jgi:prolyl 4-hydroxylase
MAGLLLACLVLGKASGWSDEGELHPEANGVNGQTKIEITHVGGFDSIFEEYPAVPSPEQAAEHPASALEDLVRLLSQEEHLLAGLAELRRAAEAPARLQRLLMGLPNPRGGSREQMEERLGNPVAALQLVWRLARVWPRKTKALLAHWRALGKEPLAALFPISATRDLPSVREEEVGAAMRGLLSLQHYHNISCSVLAEGFGQPEERLSKEQMEVLARTATAGHYLRLAVAWLEEARRRAPAARLDRALRRAREEHDRRLMTLDLGEFDQSTNLVYHMAAEPYDEDLRASDLCRKKIKENKEFAEWSSQDRDLFQGVHPSKQPWAAIYVGQDGQRARLCRGEAVRRTTSHCSWLHRAQPALRLGPFKYEEIRTSPWVGIIRDLAQPEELEAVKQEARRAGLVPTTLLRYRDGEYSYDPSAVVRRTSKVTYRSERQLPALADWSARLERATGLRLRTDKFDSENYQIMNYGLGGAILAHRDSDDVSLDDPTFSESWPNGGPRLATVMVWLAPALEGGRTVFAGAGIGVEGEAGAALLWWNLRSDGSLDSRNHHTGCPVVRGSKWVANKWVRWPAQMWSMPCARQRGRHYRGIQHTAR